MIRPNVCGDTFSVLVFRRALVISFTQLSSIFQFAYCYLKAFNHILCTCPKVVQLVAYEVLNTNYNRKFVTLVVN